MLGVSETAFSVTARPLYVFKALAPQFLLSSLIQTPDAQADRRWSSRETGCYLEIKAPFAVIEP